ncbi:MAG: DUF2029 domain-containing protein [Phyllobacteriaceae bacterium]|nr:DUF2029 domain-containing protein [Phyllobacteriaceae bacterium]
MPLMRAIPFLAMLIFALVYGFVGIAACHVPTGDGLANYGGGVVGNDFLAFYSAAQLTLRGTADAVFDHLRYVAMQDEISPLGPHHPWAYPPHLLIVLTPLGLLPYLAAFLVWTVATAAPFVLMLRARVGFALPILLLAPPILQNALVGQNGALTASLIFGGVLALAGGRSILAGVLFGLLVYKPQVAILMPIALLAARDFRALAAFVAAAVALPLLSLAVFGLDIWWAFLRHLPEHMELVLAGKLPAERFPTVYVAVERLTGDRAIAEICQLAAMLAAWAGVYTAWRRSRSPSTRLITICLALPFAAPFLLEYDLAIWAVPGLMAAKRVWLGHARRFDRVAMVLWLMTPPVIWLTGVTRLSLGLLPVTALLVLHVIPWWRSAAAPTPAPVAA